MWGGYPWPGKGLSLGILTDSIPRLPAMALPPPLGPRPPSEPLNHPPGAPREPDIGGFTLCPTSEERLR